MALLNAKQWESKKLLTSHFLNLLLIAANSQQQPEIANNNSQLLLNISETQRSIERYNDYQTIINEEVFGPLMNDSVIIVVQVHMRITYLRHLIVSLAQARDISRTLLIFSHDFYDEEINQLVQSIDFCRVMQIFYPFSIQTHPNEFPGTVSERWKCEYKSRFSIILKLILPIGSKRLQKRHEEGASTNKKLSKRVVW